MALGASGSALVPAARTAGNQGPPTQRQGLGLPRGHQAAVWARGVSVGVAPFLQNQAPRVPVLAVEWRGEVGD